MAKPIKNTPVLKGKDALQFRKDNEVVKKVSTEERERLKNSYEALKSIAQFAI